MSPRRKIGVNSVQKIAELTLNKRTAREVDINDTKPDTIKFNFSTKGLHTA